MPAYLTRNLDLLGLEEGVVRCAATRQLLAILAPAGARHEWIGVRRYADAAALA
jgi:hypothetical protein